ncbi:MAG: thioredoxin [Candidatus Heimdallarchaeum aukensis]|uniref:Thioredoxin n=1 Tax=Candidatus Heimdallarchaeum aukensis TaxID=2876573 RepID=A0A9Y1BJF3_9ARCH|nr:MAG: thioredoxin [Candidatus Heimdallarchaeum aukensis]
MIQDDETLEELRKKKMEELLNANQQAAKFPTGVAVNLTDDDFDEFVKQDGIVVVDTWAAWCMPCRTMAPIMDQLAKEWADKGVHIGKLNVDENRRTAMRFGISSIPNFLVFQNGKYLGNVVGAVGKKPFVQLFKKLLNGDDETKAGYA